MQQVVVEPVVELEAGAVDDAFAEKYASIERAARTARVEWVVALTASMSAPEQCSRSRDGFWYRVSCSPSVPWKLPSARFDA